jgi:hypothetical protein
VPISNTPELLNTLPGDTGPLIPFKVDSNGQEVGTPSGNGDLCALTGNGYTLVILSNFGPLSQKFAQFVSNRLPTVP